MTPRAPGAEGGVTVREREWSGELETYYQAKAQSRTGLVYEWTIIESPWGPSRGKVYETVRAMAEVGALLAPPAGSAARAGTAETPPP